MAEAGWVHRDISYNNVMLYTPSDEYPAKPYADTKSARRGTLIDLDYTVPMQETRDGVRGSVGVRTVSYDVSLPKTMMFRHFPGYSSIHGIVNSHQ